MAEEGLEAALQHRGRNNATVFVGAVWAAGGVGIGNYYMI